ncbi:hypothetical protein [Geotoga petraea]|uniref:Uncharacterized protein n=1 Tax=Geotoga petraea TaxID=28234 RepID=A0A4Z0W499_9BACT|nr:hypothetical protein [Geotoga petraea]TGG88646.1 hypothetical protein E4650_00110 [Geotoga petraea]
MYIFLDYDGTLNLTDERTYAKTYYGALFDYTGLDPEMYLDAINSSLLLTLYFQKYALKKE